MTDQRRPKGLQPAIGLVCVAVMMVAGCNHDSGPKPGPNDSAATTRDTENADATVGNGSPSKPPALDRDAEISRADALLRSGDFDGAAQTLQKVLLVEPNDFTVLFKLASVEAARGDLPKAIDLLGEIPEDDPVAGLPALGQSADWCAQLERYDDAERRYLKVLESVPQAVPARRQLAHLLNRQGRRQEASVHIRELCKQGNIRHDELQSLLVLNEAIYDDSSGAVDSARRPIQPGGNARILFGKGQFQEVVKLLEPIVRGGDAPPAMLALYGRAAAEVQDDERYAWWLSQTDQRTREHGDFWAAVGTYESSQRQFDSATRALAEAIDRNPTDHLSIGRIRQCLSTLGEEELSDRWYDRWLAIRSTAEAHARVVATDPPNLDAMAELASLLFHMDRPLEAALWKSIEAHHRGRQRSELAQWNAERQKLVASGTGFPSRADRLCSMDLKRYPLPKFEPIQPSQDTFAKSPTSTDVASPAKLRNIAEEIGLDHTYFIASRPLKQQYSIYQTLGGGVAVLDYDLDGSIDLYLVQGGADPPSYQGELTNQLFRHVDSTLADVTAESNAGGTQYGIGVTAGDWNQDGFADLVVANIGTDQLLINNGDGTFRQQPLSDTASKTQVPASTAMADINGDHIPDIIQSIYVDDPQIDLKPPLDDAGRVTEKVSPGDFETGSDWLIENDGAGGFDRRQFDTSKQSAHPGLGVIVTDFDERLGNEVFVGNDLYPNQLWVRDPDTGDWSNAAAALGCAFGFSGLATGSMGIATGDFDKNGKIDIHVTNFEGENVSLFMGQRGAYRDQNVHYRLGEPSKPLVGFGTQTIDYENDGDLDLVVTNGHLDDALDNTSAFMQPAQLFSNLGDRFQLTDVADSSGYWSVDHLGRGLARLDFNRDGQMDFVITHIGEQSALLLNQTPTRHHWLQLQLVGTKSERDSIGAKIRIRFAGKDVYQWVVAGDGYLSRNEAVIAFGLGDATSVEEIEILWPSGEEQTFQDVAADQRLLIIEGQEDSFQFAPVR